MKKRLRARMARTAPNLVTRFIVSFSTSIFALFIAPSAQAEIRVDRNFGMNHPQQAPAPLATVPANAVRGAPVTDDSGGVDGAYAADAVSPVIYSKNVVYPTPFPLPLRLPARATITRVAWKYGTQTRPVGFDAALCWKDNKNCRNVTRLGSGQTDAFNGKDASQPFSLIYQVVGVGNLAPPVQGAPAQIIVSYRLWP